MGEAEPPAGWTPTPTSQVTAARVPGSPSGYGLGSGTQTAGCLGPISLSGLQFYHLWSRVEWHGVCLA